MRYIIGNDAGDGAYGFRSPVDIVHSFLFQREYEDELTSFAQNTIGNNDGDGAYGFKSPMEQSTLAIHKQ